MKLSKPNPIMVIVSIFILLLQQLSGCSDSPAKGTEETKNTKPEPRRSVFITI